jgi:hypothetical protein
LCICKAARFNSVNKLVNQVFVLSWEYFHLSGSKSFAQQKLSLNGCIFHFVPGGFLIGFPFPLSYNELRPGVGNKQKREKKMV